MHKRLMNLLAVASFLGAALVQAADSPPHPARGPLDLETPALSPTEAATIKNPIPSSDESIARGRNHFFALGCPVCHGNDGKATIDVVANATDLTDPSVWKNGTREGEVFRSIRDGAGIAMPPFKGQLTQEDEVWDLVNFLQSLWPADRRPSTE
jgi:mono/diheme cytochrome c family protein